MTGLSRRAGSPGAVGAVFIGAGALHFLTPRTYEQIMPPWVPAHHEMVLASGAAEIAGGAAMLHPRTRALGTRLLVATLLGVFPANLHMALHPEQFPKVPGGVRALWARLPLQAAFMAWVLRAGRR